MIKNYIIRLGLVLIVVFVLMSCEKIYYEIEPLSEVYEYPLKTGNSWNYHRRFIVEYFDISDSTNIIDRDTIESDYIIQNGSKVILNDSITAYKLISTNLTSNVTSYEYCNNNSQGFYCYAYKLNDGAEPFAKKLNIQNFYINYPIMNIFLNFNEIKSDSLFIENPPAKILSYPITYNTKWTLRGNCDYIVYKEIIGNEFITINQTTYECYKIRYSYSNNINENVVFTDYIASTGLVKRSVITKNLIISNVNGEILNQRCNCIENVELIDCMLN